MKSIEIEPAHRRGLGRSPYGERGLKYVKRIVLGARKRRSPYGERGLKFSLGEYPTVHVRRSPYGERGLKYSDDVVADSAGRVALLTESVD